ALSFAVLQGHEFFICPWVTLALPTDDALKANFGRGFDSDEFEVFGFSERFHFGRISDRVDDVMFIVLDLRENALGQNRRAMPLSKLVTDNDQAFAGWLLAS